MRTLELEQLTPRETEVLTLIAQGLSNDEITAELVVSANTIKTHISSLLATLHARDRAALVIIAYEVPVDQRHLPARARNTASSRSTAQSSSSEVTTSGGASRIVEPCVSLVRTP